MNDLMTLDDLPFDHHPSSLRFKYPSLPPPPSLDCGLSSTSLLLL